MSMEQAAQATLATVGEQTFCESEIATSGYPPPDVDAETDVNDALVDSAYLAGLKLGWSLACADNDQGYRDVVASRSGYLKVIAKAHPVR